MILKPHFNVWGPPGNGKTTSIRKIVEVSGRAVYIIRKDSTGTPRIGEEYAPEYRHIPDSLLQKRWREGHYLFRPMYTFENGELSRRGFPRSEFWPTNLPYGTKFTLSSFPPQAIPPLVEEREMTNILLLVQDLGIVSERLKKRCLVDGSNYAQKMQRNISLRERLKIESQVPFLYQHVVYNDGTIQDTLRQLAKIIPFLAERLKNKSVG